MFLSHNDDTEDGHAWEPGFGLQWVTGCRGDGVPATDGLPSIAEGRALRCAIFRSTPTSGPTRAERARTVRANNDFSRCSKYFRNLIPASPSITPLARHIPLAPAAPLTHHGPRFRALTLSERAREWSRCP